MEIKGNNLNKACEILKSTYYLLFSLIYLFFPVETVCYDTKIRSMRGCVALRGSPVDQRATTSR